MSSDFVCSCNATALHMASANGHLDIVDYLVRNGVVRTAGFTFDSENFNGLFYFVFVIDLLCAEK